MKKVINKSVSEYTVSFKNKPYRVQPQNYLICEDEVAKEFMKYYPTVLSVEDYVEPPTLEVKVEEPKVEEPKEEIPVKISVETPKMKSKTKISEEKPKVAKKITIKEKVSPKAPKKVKAKSKK